ncbi:MAG: hypothetical protein K2G03_02440 [Bacilli bacterium]|nr:hypothetical protein [Bacilli bacterium]MDE6141439.1 hypothetical protein [Bacilli bacterium]
MNQYLIPANSKRSMLILGLFEPIDLIIFGTGIVITVILLIVLPRETIQDMLIIFAPVAFTGVMVLPVPNHRNMWNLTANVYTYLSNRRTYYWKGWCINYGEESSENYEK